MMPREDHFLQLTQASTGTASASPSMGTETKNAFSLENMYLLEVSQQREWA